MTENSDWTSAIEEENTLASSIGDVIFNNNLIIHHFCKVVPARLLLELRLINSLCNAIAAEKMRSTHFVTLKDEHNLDWFRETMKNRIQATIPTSSFVMLIDNMTMEGVEEFARDFGTKVGYYWLYSFDKYCGRDPRGPPGMDQNVLSKCVTLLAAAAGTLKQLRMRLGFDIPLEEYNTNKLPDYFKRLEVLKIEYWSNHLINLELEQGLIAQVARRAPFLGALSVKLDYNNYNYSPMLMSSVPKLLFGLQRHRHPTLCLNVELEPSDCPIFEQLNRRYWNSIQKLSLHFDFDAEDRLILCLSNLIHHQVDSLVKLELDSYHYGASQMQLKLPIMNKLTKLKIIFLDNFDQTFISPIHPFVSNQFPNLKVLDLGEYNQAQRWLNSDIIMPTVEVFRLTDYYSISAIGCCEESFHVNFPNLKRFSIFRFPTLQFLEYILTRMTMVEVLCFEYHSGFYVKNDVTLWRLYTGGATQVSKDKLIELCRNDSTHDEVENLTADGHSVVIVTEQVASLANFKNLKTLHLPLFEPLEVEAIVFMSRNGKLPKLDVLTLTFEPVFVRPITVIEDIETDTSQLLPRVEEVQDDYNGSVAYSTLVGGEYLSILQIYHKLVFPYNFNNRY